MERADEFIMNLRARWQERRADNRQWQQHCRDHYIQQWEKRGDDVNHGHCSGGQPEHKRKTKNLIDIEYQEAKDPYK